MVIGTYISIITLNVKGLNAPTKRHRLAEWIQKQDPYICCLQEIHFRPRDTYRLKVRGWKKIFHANGNQKKAGGGASRWWKNKTRRSPSSPQIHQKYIYMWNNSYRSPTERWQKTSDFPKGKKLPSYLGRAKKKKKKQQRQKNRDGPCASGREL